jgi:ABC-type ATPase with predicted acetyltransferase domain
MSVYEIEKSMKWNDSLSGKAGSLCRLFGLSADFLRQRIQRYDCKINIKKGDIVYITGPSGAGKSVLLSELEKQLPKDLRINLSQIELPADKSVLDCIDMDLTNSLEILNTAGLSEVHCILNKPALLSDGQKERFRLAMALASGRKIIIADEFCSRLDSITAACVAYNVRRFAERFDRTFLLAGCREDILEDLQPDLVVVKELSGSCEIIYRHRGAKRVKSE